MHKFGVTDTILVKRLFETFAEHTARLDYRELLRSFIAVSGAAADQKLDLLFDVSARTQLERGHCCHVSSEPPASCSRAPSSHQGHIPSPPPKPTSQAHIPSPHATSQAHIPSPHPKPISRVVAGH